MYIGEEEEESEALPGAARVLMLGEGTRPLGRGALKSITWSIVREARYMLNLLIWWVWRGGRGGRGREEERIG